MGRLIAYRRIFDTPGARLFVPAGFVGRLPISMMGLGTVLLVQIRTGSYANAGAASALLALVQALASPWKGRLQDRLGQRPVLATQLVLHVLAVIGLVLAVELDGGMPVILLAAAATGVSMPQVSAAVRSRWSARLSGRPDLLTAFALESVLDEVISVVGPVLVTMLALQVAAPAGLLAALAAAVVGVSALAALPSGIAATGLRGAGAGGAPARSVTRVPALRVLALSGVGVGVVFGALEVAMVAMATERGARWASGPLLAALAVSSLVAGVLVGGHAPRGGLARRYGVMLTTMSVALVALPLVPGLPLLAVAAMLVGASVAPALIACFGLVERHVSATTRTEGFSWVTASMGLGMAGGAFLSGVLVDASGGRLAACVTVLGGLLAAGAALGGRSRLQEPPTRPDDPAVPVRPRQGEPRAVGGRHADHS